MQKTRSGEPPASIGKSTPSGLQKPPNAKQQLQLGIEKLEGELDSYEKPEDQINERALKTSSALHTRRI